MSDAPNFRDKLKEDLEERYAALIDMLDEALKSEANFRVDEPCPDKYCSCKHIRTFRVPDFNMKLKVAEFMANQGLGRPAQAETESDGEKVHFTRVVKFSGEGPG